MERKPALPFWGLAPALSSLWERQESGLDWGLLLSQPGHPRPAPAGLGKQLGAAAMPARFQAPSGVLRFTAAAGRGSLLLSPLAVS